MIDAEVGTGAAQLVAERALARETLTPLEVETLRRQMDEARARRLQPHFIANFFLTAFRALGGRIAKRETDRFEISNVPAALRVRRPGASIVPVATRYSRVTFEPAAIQPETMTRAELLAPGHPLMDALLDVTIERNRVALERGTVLVDYRDPGDEAAMLVALTGEIVDGTGAAVSKTFSYVLLRPSGALVDAGSAPYLDVQPLAESYSVAAAAAVAQPWLSAGVEPVVQGFAAQSFQPEHLAAVRARLVPYLERTRDAVQARLLQQVNYLHSEAMRVEDEIAAGSKRRVRIRPDRLRSMADELDARLDRRMREIDLGLQFAAKPPRVVSAALVLPAGLLSPEVARHARETQAVERRAVDAVLAAEWALGREPTEMPHNNKGYDIVSRRAGEPDVHIEVKGRISGADSVTVTYSELIHGKNLGEQHRLALVEVSPDGTGSDRLRYVGNAFARYDSSGLPVEAEVLKWGPMWERGRTVLRIGCTTCWVL